MSFATVKNPSAAEAPVAPVARVKLTHAQMAERNQKRKEAMQNSVHTALEVVNTSTSATNAVVGTAKTLAELKLLQKANPDIDFSNEIGVVSEVWKHQIEVGQVSSKISAGVARALDDATGNAVLSLVGGGKKELKMVPVPCRLGAECTRSGCRYTHPSKDAAKGPAAEGSA